VNTHPDELSGSLAGLAYALNVDAGTGHDHQSLLISDAASGANHPNVLITTSYAEAFARDPSVDPLGELFVLGLGPAALSYRAAPGGDFAGGVSIWTGFGDDTITVDGVQSRPGVHTVTSLNTGLGNDK